MPNFYFRFKFEVENAEENKDFNKKTLLTDQEDNKE